MNPRAAMPPVTGIPATHIIRMIVRCAWLFNPFRILIRCLYQVSIRSFSRWSSGSRLSLFLSALPMSLHVGARCGGIAWECHGCHLLGLRGLPRRGLSAPG